MESIPWTGYTHSYGYDVTNSSPHGFHLCSMGRIRRRLRQQRCRPALQIPVGEEQSTGLHEGIRRVPRSRRVGPGSAEVIELLSPPPFLPRGFWEWEGGARGELEQDCFFFCEKAGLVESGDYGDCSQFSEERG